jgi:hypothetical protein
LTPNNDAEQRHIIFDPIPRADGIDPSGDLYWNRALFTW